MKISILTNQFRTSVGVLCAVLIAAVASSALAAAWSPPVTLGAPKASWVATAGADRKGNAVAAWLQTDTVPYKVYASIRRVGSLTFGPPTGLSGPSTFNPYPLLARIDRLGNIFVVWADQGAVYGVVRSAGASTWPRAELIASGVSLVNLATDNAGNATMLVGTLGAVQVIDRPVGGSWGAPQTIVTHTFSGATGLAMADDGGAVAIWETFDKVGENYTNFVLHASRRPDWGGSWGPAADLSTPLDSQYSHAATIAMDPLGNAVVVGRQLDGDTNLTLGALTSAADSDTWSALQLVTAIGTQAGYPALAVDGAGLATLVWADFTSGPSEILMATARIPVNAWTAPLMISQAGVVTGYPAVGTNRAGIAAVTWPTINTNGSMSIQATIRPGRVLPWGVPVTLSTSPTGVSNALPWIDNAGRVLAVWNETPPGSVGQTTKTSTYLP